MRKYLTYILASVSLLNTACQMGDLRKTSAFEEEQFRVIDTGLEQSTLYGPDIVGVWANSDIVLLNALQSVEDAQKKRLFRIVRISIKGNSFSSAMEGAIIRCKARSSAAAVVEQNGEWEYVGIDEKGNITNLNEKPSINRFCIHDRPRYPERLQSFLNEGDGYIDRGQTGHGFSSENAILYRPDKPPVELPVPGGEIVAGPVYVPFLHRYLLNYWDNLSGNHSPSGKAVFRLMTPDGVVSEIPQPRHFVETVAPFGRMYLMRDGMVLDRTGPGRRNPGLYFVSGEHITRFYGAEGHIATRILPSPDGCKLAFLAMKNYDFATKKTIKIVDFCGAKSVNLEIDRDTDSARH